MKRLSERLRKDGTGLRAFLAEGHGERAVASFHARDLDVISAGGFLAEKNSDNNFLVKIYGWGLRWIRFHRGVFLPKSVPLGLGSNNDLSSFANSAARALCNGLKKDLAGRRRIAFSGCGY